MLLGGAPILLAVPNEVTEKVLLTDFEVSLVDGTAVDLNVTLEVVINVKEASSLGEHVVAIEMVKNPVLLDKTTGEEIHFMQDPDGTLEIDNLLVNEHDDYVLAMDESEMKVTLDDGEVIIVNTETKHFVQGRSIDLSSYGAKTVNLFAFSNDFSFKLLDVVPINTAVLPATQIDSTSIAGSPAAKNNVAVLRQSIHDAVEAADANEPVTIQLPAANYDFNVSSLLSANNVTLKSYDPNNPAVIVNSNVTAGDRSKQGTMRIDGNNVTLDGITLNAPAITTGGRKTLEIAGDNVTIINSVIHGNYDSTIMINGIGNNTGTAITNFTIKNNSIDNGPVNIANGVGLNGSASQLIFEGNTLTNSALKFDGANTTVT
ncbi:unnamed protein product [Didymodactylos carnosus]|uniref:Uncharacterized protein n=1 Tax=Didymodactylos carnosus TaxID=1234261 RepID=A0A8S2GCV9_9BILA|nr:unnamed protein product [Didymodactylos carnosus]CAF3491833.1 unnamed protein product [Didymodactylos carnosus]